MTLVRCVVDASVCVKLFIAEEDSQRAIDLFADTETARHAPDLLLIECANVLWTKVRRGTYLASDAVSDLQDLRATDTVVAPTAGIVVRAFELANEFDISAYDACYVALAESLGVPLVTADEKLATKLTGTAHEVVTLAMEIP